MKLILTFLYMSFILIISVISIPGDTAPFTGSDKVVHFVMYAIMGFLWAWVFLSRRHGKELVSVFIKVLLITFFYGLFIEFVQGFLPAREASLFDALANGLGGAAGVSVYYLVYRYASKLREGL